MTAEVTIAGVGMHRFGRFPDASLKDLTRVAVANALDDAGLGVKDIEAVYAANAMGGLLQGQEQIRGQAALRDIGLERVPIVNVENACASGSSALREAVLAIKAGETDVALAVGFEKMFVGDRDRSLGALETAADVEIVRELGIQFTAVYAMRLRKLLDAGKLEHRHLVDVTIKSHRNGALNPYAQFQDGVTAEQVESSTRIADPLTLLMCSAICDGAAAAILARRGVLDTRKDTIGVRATAATSGFTRISDDEPATATVCAEKAYERAGLGPEDIDVAEVHDAMAPGELLYYEQLGFCEPGGAGELLESGATEIGGKIAVNPSGGLCSRGHPVGATGLAQIAELVWQLRGEAGPRQAGRPRIALAQNSGGWLSGESAACNVTILEREAAWN
ncbi:MAG TPA: beta-ketoacyl synthase N-terminal-like domain-containing protein [Gaiellaceae bacterium]|nr:beta-ketoacyl synthase N-terminal-like domain-containing protein [Gaiellaceae bacterium]